MNIVFDFVKHGYRNYQGLASLTEGLTDHEFNVALTAAWISTRNSASVSRQHIKDLADHMIERRNWSNT